MKKISYIIFSILLSISVCQVILARDVSDCSNLKVKSECNSSREKDSHKACSWDSETSTCSVSNRANEALSDGSAPDVDSCAGFIDPNECSSGRTANNGNFGCAWNKQYKFCSPNGLAYLSCGDPTDNTDAHDIPVMVPRLVAYFIVVLKTATPIVLIIMGMVQIIKAIANTNEDEIKKAKSSLIKKLVAAALVFFSISIVQFVVDQVVDDDEKGSLSACMKCFINNDCNGSIYYTDGYGNCYYLSNKGEAVDCKTDIGSKTNNQFLPSNSSTDSSHGSSGSF